MSKTNSKILVIVILSTIFGLSSGVVGAIFARSYIVGTEFNIPLFGDIDYRGNNYGNSNLIISNPKNVIIEQNEKVVETANSVKSSIVGIYLKKEKSTTAANEKVIDKSKFNINDYYQLNSEIGQGFIVTSDGWILSSFIPKEIISNKNLTNEKLSELFSKYLIISQDKKIYQVDNILYDEDTNYAFWHTPVNDLPVRGFVSEGEVKNGQLVMAVNWEESIWLTTVLSRQKSKELVQSSDVCLSSINLSQSPTDEFKNSFLFSLNGNLISMIDSNGEMDLVSNFSSAIASILRDKKITRATLGVNYAELSDLVKIENNFNINKGAIILKNVKGVAVEKDSPAELVGLAEGDIIVVANGVEINKDNRLCDIISRKLPGENLLIEYLRNNEKKTVDIKLVEKK